MKKYYVADILKYAPEHAIVGNAKEKYFANIKPVNEANEESLAWISPVRKDKQQLLAQTGAKIIICDNSLDMSEVVSSGKCCIVVSNPKLVFLRIASALFIPQIIPSVHSSAIVHPNAVIGEQVYIGPNSSIGECTIGANSVIYGNCYIYDGTVIGENVTIHAGTIIGADGFGYVRNEAGNIERFPHIGGVIIEDNVDIGANTCIDRGSLGNTIIKKDAKIDNLVHIAHNVVIGARAFVIAHAMIGGSTVIGDDAWIAPNAGLRDGLVIGSNATIGLGAVVTKNVPDEETWLGNPAQEISLFKMKK